MPINDPEKSENMRKSIRVYSGSSNRPLAQKIAEYLGVELSGLTLKQFANGEIYARYDETVRATTPPRSWASSVTSRARPASSTTT